MLPSSCTCRYEFSDNGVECVLCSSPCLTCTTDKTANCLTCIVGYFRDGIDVIKVLATDGETLVDGECT